MNKKKKVDITEESLKDLMQETYNEIVDEKNRALSAYKKFTKDINENTDIALVGKITNELLKIMDSAIEKKLRLIKLQGDILYKTGKQVETSSDYIISDEEKKWIQTQLQNTNVGDNTKEYDE
jgi:predicted CoA-binding protein